jgi:predicted Zn-dependent protease
MALGLLRNPATLWVSAAVLLQMLALMPVFITERYRMAAAPGLIILGAYALCRLWQTLLDRQWKAFALQSGVALAALAIVFLPKVEVPLGMESYNLAISELDAEQFGLAKRHLDEAEAVAPNDPRLLFAFGNFWLSQGDLNRTNSYYRRALEHDPRNADLLTNLGVVALLEKHPEIAQKYLGDAVTIDPDDADRWYLLARAKEAGGQTEGASEAVEKALHITPQRADYKELRDRLGGAQGR